MIDGVVDESKLPWQVSLSLNSGLGLGLGLGLAIYSILAHLWLCLVSCVMWSAALDSSGVFYLYHILFILLA